MPVCFTLPRPAAGSQRRRLLGAGALLLRRVWPGLREATCTRQPRNLLLTVHTESCRFEAAAKLICSRVAAARRTALTSAVGDDELLDGLGGDGPMDLWNAADEARARSNKKPTSGSGARQRGSSSAA